MPKATIHEHGQFRADKYHVGTRSSYPVLQPVAQTKRPCIATQTQLRAGVASFDTGHHLATLLRCEKSGSHHTGVNLLNYFFS